MNRVALPLAVVVAFLAMSIAFPRDLKAQVDPPQITASAEPRSIEVGEAFSVSMTVTVDSSAPSPTDPRLAVTEGLRSGPPSVSTQTQISFVNGRMTRRSGITATWTVGAAREGIFVVTPSVSWNGKRITANAQRITVHAATPGGRRRQAPPSMQNPFDPFGMFPNLPKFFDAPDLVAPAPPPLDPELALDAPLDSRVFLRAVADKKNPVVGEQVTLTVYVYTRLSTLEASDVHEPSVPDFFLRELMPQGSQPASRTTEINGVVWTVQAILKKALFPLRPGDLEIGSMKVTFNAARSGGGPIARESQVLKVPTAEPPASGRPVGYQLGDVGSYTLSASVEPRTSEVGGAVSVTATLSGTGNVPTAIRTPASAAAEWLDPQMRESIDVENGKIRGSRSFAYVVRPKTAGTLDLGEITLPYWNPERKAYEVARALLGKIQVTPGVTPPSAKDPTAPTDPWASVAAPRTRLGSYARIREPMTDRPLYWLGLAAGPLAVVVGSLGSRSVKRLRARLAARRASAGNAIDRAVAQAHEARKKNDGALLASALERAIYLAIERATGLKARALMLDEVPAALEDRSVPADLAKEVRDLLSSVEAARFTPDSAPRSSDLSDHVVAWVRRMGRLPLPGKA